MAVWTVALAALLSARCSGEPLGQSLCEFCWFEPAFLFPLAVLLGVGLVFGMEELRASVAEEVAAARS